MTAFFGASFPSNIDYVDIKGFNCEHGRSHKYNLNSDIKVSISISKDYM